MTKRACVACEWFDGGLCRRLPPTMPPWPTDNQHPVLYTPSPTWPNVSATEWCGEFREAAVFRPT